VAIYGLRGSVSVLAETPVGLLAYCLMPNHWHFLLRPEANHDPARFMQRLTITHTRRWKEHYHEVGHGPLYQGRFKSFPVQDDAHLRTVARYIERNALRAKLVKRAQDWHWSSLWRRLNSPEPPRPVLKLTPWPVPEPVEPENGTGLIFCHVSYQDFAFGSAPADRPLV